MTSLFGLCIPPAERSQEGGSMSRQKGSDVSKLLHSFSSSNAANSDLPNGAPVCDRPDLANGTSPFPGASGDSSSKPDNRPTWVHEIFQGVLTSETKCLNCETVSSKDEDFFDLQVDVDQNTSITHCLRKYSHTETLCSEDKFKCDNCASYQEAQVQPPDHLPI